MQRRGTTRVTGRATVGRAAAAPARTHGRYRYMLQTLARGRRAARYTGRGVVNRSRHKSADVGAAAAAGSPPARIRAGGGARTVRAVPRKGWAPRAMEASNPLE